MLDVASVSELLHVLLFGLRFFLRVLLSVMMDKLFQLFYSYFVEFKLLFFFLKNEKLFLFLYSLLHKLSFDGLNLLIPASFRLFPLFLELSDLVIKLLNHLIGNVASRCWLGFFGFFFILFNFLLHLLYLCLLCDINLVILSENSLVLQQFFREVLALLFCLRDLFF